MYAWVSRLLISQLQPPPPSQRPLLTRQRIWSFSQKWFSWCQLIQAFGTGVCRKKRACCSELSEEPGDQPRGFCWWRPPVALSKGPGTEVGRVGTLQALSQKVGKIWLDTAASLFSRRFLPTALWNVTCSYWESLWRQEVDKPAVLQLGCRGKIVHSGGK